MNSCSFDSLQHKSGPNPFLKGVTISTMATQQGVEDPKQMIWATHIRRLRSPRPLLPNHHGQELKKAQRIPIEFIVARKRGE
jgi:hypothetical protein